MTDKSSGELKSAFNVLLDLPNIEVDEVERDREGNYSPANIVKGLNNKIKVIKRRCYGLKNIGHLFQHLYLDLCGHALDAHQKSWSYRNSLRILLRHKKVFTINNILFLNRINTPAIPRELNYRTKGLACGMSGITVEPAQTGWKPVPHQILLKNQ